MRGMRVCAAGHRNSRKRRAGIPNSIGRRLLEIPQGCVHESVAGKSNSLFASGTGTYHTRQLAPRAKLQSSRFCPFAYERTPQSHIRSAAQAAYSRESEKFSALYVYRERTE